MRRCLIESIVHARGRAAFGGALAERPLLRQSLLEMLLDAEAAATVVLNGAAMFDRVDAGSATDQALLRVVTPIAKYWITSRARVVTGEAMNVRGGNGYVEEWVNARLLRDSHLGGIWEGATNVVALDVQRALLRDGSGSALAEHLRARLAAVTEPALKPWVDAVNVGLDEVFRRVEAWHGLAGTDRELEARPVADMLYHLLAGSLLLGEGQHLRNGRASFRKFLVAALYLSRWLGPSARSAPPFSSRALAWLDALVDWEPIGAEALSAVPPPH
jgi:hypothetical protein